MNRLEKDKIENSILGANFVIEPKIVEVLDRLKKAVIFNASPTTSYEFLVKDSQGKDYIFEARYDWEYFLYDGFEEYLKLDRVNGL